MHSWYLGTTSYCAHLGRRRRPAWGFDALDYQQIRHGDAGKLGNYAILSVLPDMVARFLYKFHDFRFDSLDLPPLPADCGDFDVHGALEDDKVPYMELYLHCII